MNLDFLDNKYFFAIFSILMLMYAAQIRQPLPQFMMDLFQNPIFRIAILFLILVRGYKDIQFSLIVSVAFILIMNIVNEQLFKESFMDTTTDMIAQQNTDEQLFNESFMDTTTDMIAQQNTDEQLFNESFMDTTTDMIAQQNTNECYMIQQKMNDIKKCQEQNNLFDCSKETDINKETCEKNNDDITGLMATLGRKEYGTSLKLNEKCKNANMNNNNISSPLICKNI